MKLTKYNRLANANKANRPGVKTTYKLIGKDHIKERNIKICLDFKAEIIAKQAGRPNMTNVTTIELSAGLE
jgi:spore maturation protein CgeB